MKLCDKYAVPLLKERLVKFRNAMRMSANRETRDQIRRCFIAAMKCGFVDLAPNSLMFDVDMGSFVVCKLQFLKVLLLSLCIGGV